MNKYFKTLSGLMLSMISVNSFSDTPIFLITSNTKITPQLVQGQSGTAIYQVINNSNRILNNIVLTHLPAGITQVSNPGPDYCNNLTALNSPGSLCLIELHFDSYVNSSLNGGPIICTAGNLLCSQPYQSDQLLTQVTPGPVAQTCTGNENNFSYELTQPFDSGTIDPGTIYSWGPARNQLFLSPSNPNLTVCPTEDPSNSNAINWMRSRLIAAESFWVSQKLNYCHHHVTDFYTPITSYGSPRSAIGTSDGGYCSNATSLAPANYGQQIRWNYSGTGSETVNTWVNQNRMWYGVDCSDFTSFVYNFSFGIQFNSDTGYQAGQSNVGHAQDFLLPNTQTSGSILGIPTYSTPANDPAGLLLCKDGSVETRSGSPNDYCGGGSNPNPSLNGYFSVFLNDQPPTSDSHFPVNTPSNITPAMLNLLKPGDLLYLAFPPGSGKGDGNNPTSVVTHVITWTGQKVGYGPDDINPTQIAPESICPTNWQPQVGDWVIIDSHYQGPDYRDFTSCFYQNNIWGVRRVIGYMHS